MVRLLLLLLAATLARAHDGPPFPIWMDRVAGAAKVSVWADPDVGEGSVYVAVDGAEPADVRVSVQPVSRRLATATCAGERMPMKRVQFVAKPRFDRQEMWTLTVEIPALSVRWSTDLEATPDGAGAWDLVIYLFPFVCFGMLWTRALLRR